MSELNLNEKNLEKLRTVAWSD